MTRRSLPLTKEAAAPRPTRAAALLLATGLSLPVFLLLSLAERWLL
ncbi:hypothetical protein [Albibacillus kandeliae]|nr:hypothetical protein [Albibacillus kandeliae]